MGPRPHPDRAHRSSVHKVFTGEVPFHNSISATVVMDVLSGNRPDRPTDLNLSDDLWDLTEQCWNHDPRRRPEISEVVPRLRTLSSHTDLDGTTLGSVGQEEISGKFSFTSSSNAIYSVRLEGSCYQPSRLTVASYKLQRFWKLAKSSLVSRPAPSKGSTHGVESEAGGGSVDTAHSRFSAASLPGRTGGWFSKYEAHPTYNRYDRPDSSLRKQGTPTRDECGGVSGSDFCIDRRSGSDGWWYAFHLKPCCR